MGLASPVSRGPLRGLLLTLGFRLLRMHLDLGLDVIHTQSCFLLEAALESPNGSNPVNLTYPESPEKKKSQ